MYVEGEGSAKPGDVIAEYIGELISDGETERRGAVYDEKYNRDRSLDAYRVGNLMRFANNDCIDPNCIGRVVVVDGEQRLGVYAKKDIQDGEELFFNYNYAEHHQNEFVGISVVDKKKKTDKG